MYFLSKCRKRLHGVSSLRSLSLLSHQRSCYNLNYSFSQVNASRSLSSNISNRNEVSSPTQSTSPATLDDTVLMSNFIGSSPSKTNESDSTNNDINSSSSPSMLPLISEGGIQPAHLINLIKSIPERVGKLHSKVNFDKETYDAAFAHGSSTGLFASQCHIEEQQLRDARKSYEEMTKSLMKMGRGTGMKKIQKTMLKWFINVRDEIQNEIDKVETKVQGKDRSEYGPCLLLLSPDKFAVLVLDITMNEILKNDNRQVISVHLASMIGDAVESEVYSVKIKKGSNEIPQWQQDLAKRIIASNQGGTNIRGKGLNMRLFKLIDEVKWGNQLKIKLGAALISLLLKGAKKEDGKPAFRHFTSFLSRNRLTGQIELDDELFITLKPQDKDLCLPRYLPMIIPPKKWNNKKGIGCYWVLKASLMRSFSGAQLRALSRANIDPILQGLNYLGQVGWRINNRMLDIIQEAWEVRHLLIGEFPSREDHPLPAKESCYRVVPKEDDSSSSSNESDISSSSSSSGNNYNNSGFNKFANEKNSIATAASSSSSKQHITTSSTLSNNNTNLNEMNNEVDKVDTNNNNNNNNNTATIIDDDGNTLVFDEKHYNRKLKRVIAKNRDLHSLRCDLQIKLKIAQMFKDDTIYYPYSLDFRGRAYPVPPNLNHLGSDLARGLLWFDKAKPLGPTGLHWLKVHLANLFGHNKISHTDRAKWTEGYLTEIRDSAMLPLDGKKWWMQAEEPFQALATCIEIIAAIDYVHGHEMYECRLPVHQDGSCNGLQHYAALGKDESGGVAVNLVPSDIPQDVYSKVLHYVLRKIDDDATLPSSMEAVMHILNSNIADDEDDDDEDNDDEDDEDEDEEEEDHHRSNQWRGKAATTKNNKNNKSKNKKKKGFKKDLKDDLLKKAQALIKRGEMARLLQGMVNRKVIKQTVMTSVYGVTRLGARLQVQSKLEEKIMEAVAAGYGATTTSATDDNEEHTSSSSSSSSSSKTVLMDTYTAEMLLFHSSRYVANLTLDSLRDVFYSAKLIMDWLGNCASLLAKNGETVTWITPLGLPVIQPYRKTTQYSVSTVLQSMTLAYNSDDLPVSSAKQKSAFPPNFVHSLDATHMLMTCLKMKQNNITFASVHDSYWTHACDIDTMNTELREAFVELYSQPVLEKFRNSLVMRYPHIDFPPLPERGTLDIQKVKESKYFFH